MTCSYSYAVIDENVPKFARNTRKNVFNILRWHFNMLKSFKTESYHVDSVLIN